MTVKYLDLESGSDAADGLSFANRKLTLASCLSGMATGDHEIRIKASKPATLVGNATWTNASRDVTLAAPVTQLIDDCEAAWTAAPANVTAATNSALYRMGTKSVSLNIAGAFTTGKIGYRATGTLDLSGYQQVSFWIKASATINASCLQLKLCTDVAGDVAVHTHTIVPSLFTNIWTPITIDFGVNLNAAIASIALYSITDTPTATIYLDHFFASKAASAADSLTLVSLISQNLSADDPWFGIQGITGSVVTLRSGDYNLTPQTYETYWFGTTGVAPTYKREAIPSTVQQVANVYGSSPTATCKYTGGWNRTDMSTQDDVTWITSNVYGNGYNWTLSGHYQRLEKVYIACNGNNGISTSASVHGQVLNDVALVAPSTGIFMNSLLSIENLRYVTGSVIAINNSDGSAASQPLETNWRIGKMWGSVGASMTSKGSSAVTMNQTYEGVVRMDVDEIRNQGVGIQCAVGINSGHVYVHNCAFNNPASGGALDINPGNKTVFHLDNCSFTPGLTPLAGGPTFIRKYNKTADDHRIYFDATGSVAVCATDPVASK